MSIAEHIVEHAVLGISGYNPAAVAITGGTIAGITSLAVASGSLSASAPAINLTQTWNGVGVGFSAAKVNITNTASQASTTFASGSSIFDAQVASASVWKVDVTGKNKFSNYVNTLGQLGIEWFYQGYGLGSNNNGETVVYVNGNQRVSLGATSIFGSISGGSFGTVSFNTAPASGNAIVNNSTTGVKLVTAIADATPTAIATVTIPNGLHSATIKVTVAASLGAGGAIGAGEATGSLSWDIAVARTAGVNAVATASAVYGSATSAVAGAATITLTPTLGAISGAVGASNTFTILLNIARGSGASTNHTALVKTEVLNLTASGIAVTS